MAVDLRVLLVEDTPTDAELLLNALRRGGYEPACTRVETQAAMRSALEQSSWDLVISDYSLPAFSGMAALETLRQHGPDIPFILVSGEVGEAAAVAALKAGAHDFVPKDNLARLVPAIQRELREAATRRDHERARRMLEESEQKLRLFVEHAPSAIAMFDRDMRYVAYSRRWLTDYRLGEQDLVGRSHYEVFPDMPGYWKEIHRKCLAGAIEKREEDPYPRSDGTLDWIRWEVRPWRTRTGEVRGIIMFTEVITERKDAQDALRRSAEDMRSLTLRLSQVEEAERVNIHRELHDQVGASLSALRLELNLIHATLSRGDLETAGARLLQTQALTGEAIARIRNVMADLRPPGLDDFGLLAALRMHVEAVARRLDVPAFIDGNDIAPRLPRPVETALFRIAQEALNNVSKHAHARRIDVRLDASGDQLTLTVADDGDGFDPAGVDPQRTNWGLRTMRERAQAIGAALSVDSAPGKGTRVTLLLQRDKA